MMTAKERAIDALEFFKSGQNVSAESVFNLFMSAIKEELTQKDQTYQEFFGLEPKPQLIQGYTAEQWQEIIDGGYLCEVANNKIEQGENWDEFEILGKVNEDGFTDTDNYRWEFCRPAQIKGVMRPIFVEPVDKTGSVCHFFDEIGMRVTFGNWDKSSAEPAFKFATKYIEL